MILPTLTAIVTAHADSPMPLLRGLAQQTVPPTHVLVGISDYPEPEVGMLPFSASCSTHENENDFGYGKRNRMLKDAACDFVGFFCHDDSYEPTYIEEMLTAAKDADAAYCWWDESNQRLLAGNARVVKPDGLKAFEASLGAFIVRTQLMKKIGGFPFHALPELELAVQQLTCGQAVEIEGIRATALGWLDGMAFQLLREVGVRAVRVPKLLYHHNRSYDPQMRSSVWGEKE